MPTMQTQSGFASIGSAKLYYEVAGSGQPLVMIHAGVADSRQWNNEFVYFANRFRVLRYDLRGYGKSEPVGGEFSHLGDLTALLDHLQLDQPLILIGCSMGGGLALDFALEYPSRVKTLVMVGAGPTGLELDTPAPALLEEAEQAYQAGELDLAAELEIQIWFDGSGRSPTQVNQTMRQLAYEMNRNALAHAAQGLGTRLPDTQIPGAERLSELQIPVLAVVGAHDTPYLLAAATHMVEKIPSVRKVVIEDAAHLPNMDQPAEFQQIITTFLEGMGF